MGIQGDVLAVLYGDPIMRHAFFGDDDGQHEFVMVDMSLLAVRIMAGGGTGRQMEDRLRESVAMSGYSPAHTKYLGYFMDKTAPVVKGREQAARQAANVDRFTAAELTSLRLGADALLPGGRLQAIMGSECTVVDPATGETVAVRAGCVRRHVQAFLSDAFTRCRPADSSPDMSMFMRGAYSGYGNRAEASTPLWREPSEGRCTIDVPAAGPPKYVVVDEQIGEAEQTIMQHLFQWAITPRAANCSARVNSCDSDMVAILLLNMRRLINPDTRRIRLRRVVLDTFAGRPSSKHPRYVDLVLLWRLAHLRVRQLLPLCREPIELLVTLMISSGCDYTSGLANCRFASLWAFVVNHGAGHIKAPIVPLVPLPNRTADRPCEIHPHVNFHNLFGLLTNALGARARQPPVECHVCRPSLGGGEGKPSKMAVVDAALAKGEQAGRPSVQECGFAVHLSKIVRPSPGPGEDELMADIARTKWTLFYWLNGWFNCSPTGLEVDPANGLPVWGFHQVNSSAAATAQVVFSRKISPLAM